MECSRMFVHWLCFAMVPFWISLVPPVHSQTMTKETPSGLLQSALLLSDHLDKASLRGTTSSQVIEYNARNIVLMTLLNSVLILGGLLGTINKPDAIGFPFKRVDFGNLKKRFSFRRRSQRPTTSQSASSPPTAVLPSIVPETSAYLGGLDGTVRPLSPHHLPSFLLDEVSLPVETLTYEPRPRVPVRASRRWTSEEDKSSSEVESKHQSQISEPQCSRVILCLDPNGKLYRPELSELTRTAVQVLNEDAASGKPKRSALLDRIRELVELEQNRSICRWKTICETASRPKQQN